MKLAQAYAAIRFDPSIPLWLLGALAVLCLLVLAPALLRRARGALWRTLAFAVLLLWLAGPRLVEETRNTLPDIGLIVVDKSDSMRIGDRAALRDAALARLTQQAARLPDLEMRTVVVPEAGRDGTALFAGIERALADIPRARLAGIVALTDGQVHDTPTTPLPAPLQVLIPARGEETDRRIRIVEAPPFGLVGRNTTIRLAVDDLGVTTPNAFARLSVRRDGEPPQVRSVPVGQETTIDIPITRAGPTVVEIQADALPGEVSAINNRAVISINGVRDRLRVLLVSGEPHLGERTWRRLLKADPAVDLVHFTILRPPDRDDLTPTNELSLIAFPVRELFQVKIRDFDLIILDRFSNRNNILPPLYLRNIADYVRAGGALLLSAGPEFAGAYSLAATNLGGVLPVRVAQRPASVVDGPFRPLVTALGARHPVTEGLPGAGEGRPQWGEWYRYIDAASTGGQELMSAGDGAPLLLLNRVGEGRVALLLSDQIWLWSRGHEGGGPQAELLRRIAHWAMKEPALEEDTLRARIEHDRMHIERRSLDDLGASRRHGHRTRGSGVAARAESGAAGAVAGRSRRRRARRLAGVRRREHGLRRRRQRQSARDRRSQGDGHGAGAARAVHRRQHAVHRCRAAGSAPHRAGPRGVGLRLDRPAAPQRPRGYRASRDPFAAALGGAAAAARPGDPRLATGRIGLMTSRVGRPCLPAD